MDGPGGLVAPPHSGRAATENRSSVQAGWSRSLALGVALASLAWCTGAGSTRAANDPGALETPASVPAPIDIRLDEPAVRPGARTREPRGNPLWAIPLSSLAVTRERPLLLPSRRPPAAPAVAGPPPVVVAQPVEDPRPQLSLVGAVAGETEGFAVFIDLRTNALIRLRTGQDHAGWTLNTVKGREVVLAREKDTAVFALPAPGASATAPVVSSVPAGVPDASAVAAANGEGAVTPKSGMDFAPFTPRSTPKNGEPDGL